MILERRNLNVIYVEKGSTKLDFINIRNHIWVSESREYYPALGKCSVKHLMGIFRKDFHLDTEERSHKCEHCGKALASVYVLKDHIKVFHSGNY